MKFLDVFGDFLETDAIELVEKFPLLKTLLKQVNKFRFPRILHAVAEYTRIIAGLKYYKFFNQIFPMPDKSTAEADLHNSDYVLESDLQVTYANFGLVFVFFLFFLSPSNNFMCFRPPSSPTKTFKSAEGVIFCSKYCIFLITFFQIF